MKLMKQDICYEKITAFRCSYCRVIYRFSTEANECVNKHIKDKKIHERYTKRFNAFEEKRNWVRLHSISAEDAITKLVWYAKKQWNLDIKFKQYPNVELTQGIANTHSSPIGIPEQWCNEKTRRYPAYEGRWIGTIRGNKPRALKEFGHRSSFSSGPEFNWITDLFAGFHSSCGSGGQNFDISGHFFKQDFPLIQVAEKFLE